MIPIARTSIAASRFCTCEERFDEAIASYRLAARAFDQAAQEHPEAASLRLWRARPTPQGGEFPSAFNRLSLAEKLAPQDAGIELDLAQVLLVMGQKDAAVRHLDRAVASIRSSRPSARQSLRGGGPGRTPAAQQVRRRTRPVAPLPMRLRSL